MINEPSREPVADDASLAALVGKVLHRKKVLQGAMAAGADSGVLIYLGSLVDTARAQLHQRVRRFETDADRKVTPDESAEGRLLYKVWVAQEKLDVALAKVQQSSGARDWAWLALEAGVPAGEATTLDGETYFYWGREIRGCVPMSWFDSVGRPRPECAKLARATSIVSAEAALRAAEAAVVPLREHLGILLWQLNR